MAAKFGGGKLKLAASSRLATERHGFGFLAKVTRNSSSSAAARRSSTSLCRGSTPKPPSRPTGE
jgi:hypothetical protein